MIELIPEPGDEPGEPGGAGFRVLPSPSQLGEVLDRLDAIDRRLAAIERRLGLGEPPAEAEPG